MEEKNTSGHKLKTTGIILFCIGLVGCPISILSMLFGIGEGGADISKGMTYFWGGALGLAISIFLLIAGAILFFVRRSREKERKAHLTVMSLASMSCSILGVLLMAMFYCTQWNMLLLPWMFGLLAVILGVISLARSKKNPSLGGRKQAIAGLIFGILILIAVALMAPSHMWPFS
jgi:uncharacterized membrane protein